MADADADTGEQITKRKVTMTSIQATGERDRNGQPLFHTFEAVDYVRPDFLDAYLADARKNWQSVEVADEPDAGPAGYHGQTHVPAHLDHPLAGQTFAATTPKKKG